MEYNKRAALCVCTAARKFVIVKRARGLLADTELFLCDDGAIAADVFAHQVVEKTTTLANKHFKSALSRMIFVI